MPKSKPATPKPAPSGRPELPVVEAVPSGVTPEAAQRTADEADQVRLQDKRLLEAAPFYIALGRLQQANFAATVSDVSAVKAFQQMRDVHRRIGHLPTSDADGKLRNVSDFDELCRLTLGRGERRMRQIAAAVDSLGEDLYEAARLVGFKSRDYQALTALPGNAQEAVKAALASDNKEAAVEMVYELAQRLAVEKEAAAKSAADMNQQLDSRQRLLDAEHRTNAELKDKLYGPVRANGDAETNEEAGRLEALREIAAVVTVAINKLDEKLAELEEVKDGSVAFHHAVREVARHIGLMIYERICVRRRIEIDFDAVLEDMAPWIKRALPADLVDQLEASESTAAPAAPIGKARHDAALGRHYDGKKLLNVRVAPPKK
jgi:hypothetical protein